MGPTYVQQRELRDALHKQKVEFESRLLAITTEFEDALQKQKDEFESRLLEITTEQDFHSSRLVAMHRRLPMKAPLASPSKRPVHRAEEEDEAPKPKRRQMTLIGGRGTVAWDTGRDDEDKAASSAEVPPLLAAVACLGATRLPHGGPNSFPGV